MKRPAHPKRYSGGTRVLPSPKKRKRITGKYLRLLEINVLPVPCFSGRKTAAPAPMNCHGRYFLRSAGSGFLSWTIALSFNPLFLQFFQALAENTSEL
jgi:hypothetical protein